MTSKKASPKRYTPADSPGQTALKGCAVFIALVVGIFLLAIAVGRISRNTPAPRVNTTAQLPPRKVTAPELFAAYQTSTAAAQQEYGDQRLQVSGVVAGVDLDFSDNPIVSLQTSTDLMTVKAKLAETSRPKAAGLRGGQSIALICQGVFDIAGTPMLSECKIV